MIILAIDTYPYKTAILLGNVGYIMIYVFFLRNLMELLNNIRPENRLIPSNLVWLLLLYLLPMTIYVPFSLGLLGYKYYLIFTKIRYPIVGFITILQFYLYYKIANSIAKEYDDRNIAYKDKPTFAEGIWLIIAYLSVGFFNFFGINYLSLIAIIGYFIAFIVYWVKAFQVRKILRKTPLVMDRFDEDSIFKDL